MRLYSFHVRADDPDGNDAVAVKDGFCWPAFLFDLLWALYHGLWGPALGIVVFSVAAQTAGTLASLHPATVAALIVAMKIFVGLEGNDWRRRRLERRGAELVAFVAGRDAMDAERRFFDHVAPDAAHAPDPHHPETEPPAWPANPPAPVP